VTKEFYSEILGEKMRLKTAPAVLRTIDKYMGFDNYIIMTRPKYLEGVGMQLKTRMMDTLRAQPDKTANDFLNVSPECWEYLKRWDKDLEQKQMLIENAESTAEAVQIENEKKMADYRKALAEAIAEGTALPPRPEIEKPKKKSLKKFFIEKRLAKRKMLAQKKINTGRIKHSNSS